MLRPWLSLLNEKYKAFQRQEWSREEKEREQQELEIKAAYKREETSAQFPIHAFSSRYRVQDYLRLHPGEIEYRNPVYNDIEVITTQCEPDFEVAGFRPMSPFSTFIHLKIDGDDAFFWFLKDIEKVEVVARKSIKTKSAPYGHMTFLIPGGNWIIKPAREFALRGLIYDYLGGVNLEGKRLDHEASDGPYFVKYDPDFDYLGIRAPWPPVRRDGKIYGVNAPLPADDELKEAQSYALDRNIAERSKT